jgi:hypothetical protein
MSSSPSHHHPADDSEEPKSLLIPEEYLPEVPILGSAAAGSPDAAGVDGLGTEALDRLTPEQLTAIARGRVVAQWMQQMERPSAPFSLEGLVVAAMNPGQRQSRAAESVSVLSRLAVPQQLDAHVAKVILGDEPASIEPAPSALDQLVEERVEAPEAGLVKGMARRLGSVQAPRELEARLERQLDAAGDPRPMQRDLGRRLWLRSATAAVALAAGVLLMAKMDVGSTEIGGAPQATGDQVSENILTASSGLTFEVKYVSRETMSASDRAVLSAMGLTGVGGS